MPRRPNIYIKVFTDSGEDTTSSWDGSAAAYVFLGFKPWNEMFFVLSECSPDSYFFSTNKNFNRWDVVAAGELHYDEWYEYDDDSDDTISDIYYPCSTKVRPNARKQGYGVLLYRALILAAVRHAELTKSECLFGPHKAVGGATSKAAMRVYKSLVRKRYLKKTDKKNIYLPGKITKGFKPIFY